MVCFDSLVDVVDIDKQWDEYTVNNKNIQFDLLESSSVLQCPFETIGQCTFF